MFLVLFILANLMKLTDETSKEISPQTVYEIIQELQIKSDIHEKIIKEQLKELQKELDEMIDDYLKYYIKYAVNECQDKKNCIINNNTRAITKNSSIKKNFNKFKCSKLNNNQDYYYNLLKLCEIYPEEVFDEIDLRLMKKLNSDPCLGNIPIYLVLINCNNSTKRDEIIRKIKAEKLIITKSVYFPTEMAKVEIRGANESIEFQVMLTI